MRIELTTQQRADQLRFRAFADGKIVPHAQRFDREERVPSELFREMAAEGYLGAVIPKEFGGSEMDQITFGILNEEIGRGCSSVRSLITVHSMVSFALFKWGSRALKEQWVPRMAKGEVIAAFALTEPNVGSDAKSVETTATLRGDSYVLNGHKKWISFGQIADVFLVFARCEEKPAAFLVPRDSAGLSVVPIFGILGCKASMLAELKFEDCRIPAVNLTGRIGMGVSHVASTALDYGRYSVACGCVGVAQACLDACLAYTSERKQFGVHLKEHQLIQRMITEMITNLKAARLLCLQAGYLKDIKDPSSIMETAIAKYFASKMLAQVTNDAVQIHGANGCSESSPLQRYLRDAKIMEIIEGSTQIQQLVIANHGYQELMPRANAD